MMYSFTTDPIDAGSGEGAISEAIDAVAHGKTRKDPVDDETRAVVEAAKLAVLALAAALGPDVATYAVTIEGHHATKTTTGNLWVGVDAVDYNE